jgi:hypothetical protein
MAPRPSAQRVAALEARIDALETAGDYDAAIAVLGELEQLTGDDQRWHVAWMHVRAGRRPEADALWAALEHEHPADPTVPFLAGSAHAEAGEPAVAAPLFAQALERALRSGADGETLRRIVAARTEALAEADLAPGEIDDLARRALARAAAAGADTPVTTPFFLVDDFAAALDAWPDFAADWRAEGHAAYALELDQRMRAVASGAPRHPAVVPLTVALVRERSAANGLDADTAEARTRAAYEIAMEGGAIAWPPGRNDPCWCGSGTKYKRCCGR